jgi:hypothetical protein
MTADIHFQWCQCLGYVNPVTFTVLFARTRLKLSRLVARVYAEIIHPSLGILSIQHDITSTSRSLTSIGSTP